MNECFDSAGNHWVQPVAGVDAWEMPRYAFDPTFANWELSRIERVWGSTVAVAAEAGAA